MSRRVIADYLADWDALAPRQQRAALVYLTLSAPAALAEAIDAVSD